MTKKSELEDALIRAQTLADLLDGHHGAQVSCVDALEISRAATRKAVHLAGEANERAARAEQQLADRDVENVTLAKEMETAIAALSLASDSILTMRRVVAEHLAEDLSDPAASFRAGVLLSELDLAGCPLDKDVQVLRAAGDAR